MGRLTVSSLLALSAIATAQKVQVGYDKSADFSKYKTYSWAKLTREPKYPLLYQTIVGSIDFQLRNKGLTSVEKDGALTLNIAGGIDTAVGAASGNPMLPTSSGAPPALNSTMWTGDLGTAPSVVSTVSEGMLVVEFLDTVANSVVWRGTVKQKLDATQKQKSFDRAEKAIAKLFQQFPPPRK